MITNEAEIRIALQAVLVSVLALDGYWGWAVLVLLILLPWKPIFVVMGYLAQPIVDWRLQKARDRQGKGIVQIEHELDGLLRTPGAPVPHGSCLAPAKSSRSPSPVKAAAVPPSVEPLNAPALRRPEPRPSPGSPTNLAAAVAILPVIKDHLRNLPQGVLHDMDLEVEQVKFHGESADAYVRFQSPNVSGLVIRQRYFLRKSGPQWFVESREPANGSARPAPPVLVNERAPKWVI